MMITSTNRKGKNAWEIPLLKTYLTSIMIRKKVKRILSVLSTL
jgi:hypothetical protein